MAAQEKPLELWERQPDESNRAWAGFKVYMEMGPDKRSLRKAAKELGKPWTSLDRWSTKYNWPERVRAYDNAMLRISIEERRAAIREMNKRHILMAQALQKKAAQALGILPEERISARTILEYAIQAAGLERTAVIDGLKMEAERLEEIERQERETSEATAEGEVVQIYLPEKDAEDEEAAE